MRKYIIVILLVLTCTFSVGLVGCGKKTGTSPKGNEAEIEKAAILVASGFAQGRYELISQEQMKNWIDLGEIMTVIDVSPSDVYLKGHLPDAVNAEIMADEESTGEQLEAFLNLLPLEKIDGIVVVYGECTSSNASHRAAIYAADLGFTKVYRLPGGSVGWKDAGNKLTKK